MDKKVKSFAIQILRRGSYRWWGRWTAEKRSRIGRNQYVCECCGQVLPKKMTSMDHIAPVVDPHVGFNGFDDYISRLYVESNGWQRLCDDCHQAKSNDENVIRKATSAKKKLDNQ